MMTFINHWLQQQGVTGNLLPLATQVIGILIVLLICGGCFYLAKHQVMKLIQQFTAKSANQWDDLFYTHHVFSRLALLMPFILLWFIAPYFLADETLTKTIFIIIAKIGISFQVARCISALLNLINDVYIQSSKNSYLPINAAIQVCKLTIYLVAIILSISIILDRSPLYLLSGLGALTAVLLLIFQDTIKGLVASIQISANEMVALGDWIEMPKYGADGDVLEIGLNTVKVKNWDNTITTIPTYALISESFKNWRGMQSSLGRRIKRAIIFDISSVHFLNPSEIKQFSQIRLISDYIATKSQEINDFNQQQHLTDDDQLNARQLTNLGTFRTYLANYLQQHPSIEQSLTCMVRQLPATATGIPLELYCFSNDKVWINYERIQADIFDHIIAMAPHFNLTLFQHPSGLDLKQGNINYSGNVI